MRVELIEGITSGRWRIELVKGIGHLLPQDGGR